MIQKDGQRETRPIGSQRDVSSSSFCRLLVICALSFNLALQFVCLGADLARKQVKD
jgi:hypothetical protein